LNSDDASYMRRALELAEQGAGRTSPNPMVGAVIVKGGRVIGEGRHERAGGPHAEVNAVNGAGESVEGAVVYVNLEPCSHYGRTPPCADLLIEKRVKRVVIGTPDPNPLVAGGGIKKLEAAGIEVRVGVLEEECGRLNEVFFHYIQKKRPFAVLKAAMSLDGKIAAPSGESKWITGEAARRDVHLLRNRYSAIMAGVETVIRDDPLLTCRIEGGRNPRRVILDSGLRIPPESKVLMRQEGEDGGKTIIACTEGASRENAARLEALGAEILRCGSVDGRVDLQDLILKLGARGIDSVLIEGGAAVNDSAFAQGIVDKAIFYIAPKIIGGAKSKTAVGGQGVARLDDAYPLSIDSIERIGEDIKITAYRK